MANQKERNDLMINDNHKYSTRFSIYPLYTQIKPYQWKQTGEKKKYLRN